MPNLPDDLREAAQNYLTGARWSLAECASPLEFRIIALKQLRDHIKGIDLETTNGMTEAVAFLFAICKAVEESYDVHDDAP